MTRIIPAANQAGPPAPVAILPYGTWPSSIAIADVVRGGNRLAGLLATQTDIWWTEGRPAEQGRSALCQLARAAEPGELAETRLPAPWNVRNRVHEYGGGCLASDGARIWFCDDADAGIHALSADVGTPGGSTPRLLHAAAGCRYADLQWWPAASALLAVCEDHRVAGVEPENRVVLVHVGGVRSGEVQVLATGHDFFSSPAPSPDGRWLAWLTWDHPCMPWDGTTLWCAPWHDGQLGAPLRVAGGPEESIIQPSWSPSGALHFVSDRSGWWNLWRIPAQALSTASERTPVAHSLCPMDAEFGSPQWEFGMRSYSFRRDGTIVAILRADGDAQLGQIPAEGGPFAPFDLPWRDFRTLQVVDQQAWCFAGAATRAETLLRVDLRSGLAEDMLAGAGLPDTAAYSVPRPIRYPGSGEAVTHAFFYPPYHPHCRAPAGERPPLIVINHGGPTSATSSTLRLAVQFWTSRGFGVLDVNYGGSSGFGRAYRARLDGQWGVVDVEDSVAGVRWLAEQGEIDPARVAIRGSSAGGFTTLAALTFHRVFQVGVSLYGIGDLSLLATDTHKFESRYLDRLVAPWPQGAALYAERSPLNHVERLEAALLLLQGAEDKVVPPNQAERMYEAVRAKGLPVACLIFPGEQHGFRRAETVTRALAAELYFYGRIFGFEPADTLAPIAIANLDTAGGQ
jgi:dipeptidyl aminopeptidase/acylaminoacyl peptidase